MKYAIIIIINLYPLILFGQMDVKKNNINYGIGYYGDIMQFLDPGFGDKPSYIKDNPKVYGKVFNGYSIKCGYERLMSTDFILSTNLYMAKVNSYYNDPLELFWDKEKIDYYFISEISFSKDLLKNESFSLMPIVGLLYRQLFLDQVDYLFEIQDNDLVIVSYPEIQKTVMNDLGLSFGIDFRYNFKNSFFTGVSLRSNLILDIGFESINISPVCGVRF